MTLDRFAIPVFLAVVASSAWGGEIYLFGAGGRSRFDVSQDKIDEALTKAGANGLDSKTKEDGSGYKIQLGYRFNPYFAVEGGFVDLGKASYAATFRGGSATASIKAHGVNAAILGIAPFSNSFSVYGKVGLINAKAEAKLHASTMSVSVGSTNLRVNDGLGLMYEFGKNIAARLEYEEFHKLGNSEGGVEKVRLWSIGVMFKY